MKRKRKVAPSGLFLSSANMRKRKKRAQGKNYVGMACTGDDRFIRSYEQEAAAAAAYCRLDIYINEKQIKETREKNTRYKILSRAKGGTQTKTNTTLFRDTAARAHTPT